MSKAAVKAASRALPKCPTGIRGLDEITGGGLPRGRPTLACGSAGSGKTLLGIEFLVRGATQFGEPGVFMAFEETAEELAQNVRSLGFDLDDLVAQNKLAVDYVHVERGEIEEAGEYDLTGLFIRLGHAIDTVGAKRVVLDTLETLFGGFTDAAVLRSELRRLFRWLKDKGVTAVITAERGDGTLTRQGLEEYVSDCVILLDHRVADQVSTRRLRVVKYRGTAHGTNEYPFFIGERGFEVLPITSAGLDHAAPEERVSSGVPGLDAMLAGRGFYRGSSVLVSGTAGSGKSSLAAHFADAACRRGERCLYFAFEESPAQIARNMRSIGLALDPWVKKGLLRFHAVRPTVYGLETHLASMHHSIGEFEPAVVVIDPLSNLISVGTPGEVKGMLVRLLDHLKAEQITGLFVSLTHAGGSLEETDEAISSLVDTWLLVRDIESDGERNRGLYVLKSRGMAHSNQIREFLLTDRGIELVDAYLGPAGVLTGSARIAQEARERAADRDRRRETEDRRRGHDRRRAVLEAQLAAVRADLEAEQEALRRVAAADEDTEQAQAQARLDLARSRKADLPERQAKKDGKQGPRK